MNRELLLISLIAIGVLASLTTAATVNACTNTASTDCDHATAIADIYGTNPSETTGYGQGSTGLGCSEIFCVEGYGSRIVFQTDYGYYASYVSADYISSQTYYSPQGLTGSWVETGADCYCWGSYATSIAYMGGRCGV